MWLEDQSYSHMDYSTQVGVHDANVRVVVISGGTALYDARNEARLVNVLHEQLEIAIASGIIVRFIVGGDRSTHVGPPTVTHGVQKIVTDYVKHMSYVRSTQRHISCYALMSADMVGTQHVMEPIAGTRIIYAGETMEERRVILGTIAAKADVYVQCEGDARELEFARKAGLDPRRLCCILP